MLTLKIIGNDKEERLIMKGKSIKAEYTGTLSGGDKIKVLLDGCDFIAVKFDETLAESILYVPNRNYEFTVPSKSVLEAAYNPDAFSGKTRIISVREPDEEEIYAYRNIALNSHDIKGKNSSSTRFILEEY